MARSETGHNGGARRECGPVYSSGPNSRATFSTKTRARPRAFHCAELAFCFDNTDRCENMTGGTAEARELAALVSESWIQFARSGNPNHRGIPDWPAFRAEKCPTMIFNQPCQMKENPDTAERRAINPA